MFADDAEELADSGSPSPTDEFVNTVSIAYTADDEKEEFVDTPLTSTADEEDEVVAVPLA